MVASFANLLPIRWPSRPLGLQAHCTGRAKKYSYSEAQNATLVFRFCDISSSFSTGSSLVYFFCFIHSVLQWLRRVSSSFYRAHRGGGAGGTSPPSFENYKELLRKNVFSPPTPPSNPHFESVFSSYTFNEPRRSLF